MTTRPIDLRSDTVTQPTPGMREAMARAEVGDDVYGEDPTCRELEERVAGLLGHEAALFTATGTLANQLGVRVLTPPGSELVCDSAAHVVRAEQGGHAVLAGVTTRTWTGARGVVDPEAVIGLLSPSPEHGGNPHFVATAAVSVENTHNFGGGSVQPLDALRTLRERTSALGVAAHLDGARLWNAAAAAGHDVAAYATLFDTVSVCLSKGLGAPVGSLVVGSAARVAEARAWRARLGGGWRQAGVLAAAGLYALDHHRDRLVTDHENARELARRLAVAAPGVTDPESVETNIIVLDVGRLGYPAAEVEARARAAGVRVSILDGATVRLVTHLDVDADSCALAAEILARILEQPGSAATSCRRG